MDAAMGASYGSTLQNKTVNRIQEVGKHSLIGASGDISDFQEILRKLNELTFELFQVSMIGGHFLDDHVATRFGSHLARPLLWEEWKENLTFEEGVKLLEKCMRVLLYRDKSAVNKIRIAKIT